MIHFITALKPEAKPLIEHYQLKRLPQSIKTIYPVLTNKDNSISLTLSGIGKLNAACATTETYQLFEKSKHDIWLNIGIIGHGKHDIGELIIIHKIIDAMSNKQYFPSFTFKHDLITSEIHCFDFPSNDYDDVAMDMESCGFYEVASKIALTEFIHCLKVVSDNSEESLAKINAAKVSELIETQLSKILRFIDELQKQQLEILNDNENIPLVNTLLEQYHFTVSQQHQLQQLIKNINNLSNGIDLEFNLEESDNAKSILKKLQSIHEALPSKL